MNVAVMAVRNEPGWPAFAERLHDHVDFVIVADESEGPVHGGGIGPSLVWAWGEALLYGDVERVVQIDAGGSHDPDEIPDVLDSDADVCIGSRFMCGSVYDGRPWRARASAAYSYVQSFRSGATITDWTSGFRSFTPHALRELSACWYDAKMHGWQAEVLHRALGLDLSIEEVPIHYTAGESSLTWKHAFEALRIT